MTPLGSNSLIYNATTDYYGTYDNEGNWKDILFAGLTAHYLYYYGNEMTNEHGGSWICNSNQSNASYMDFVNKGSTNSKSKNEDHLYINAYCPSTAAALSVASIYLNTKIDLSNYSKLKVYANVTGTKTALVCLYNVSPSGADRNIDNTNICCKYISLSSGLSETILDLSDIAGSYYILFFNSAYAGDSGGSSGSITTKIYNVSLI